MNNKDGGYFIFRFSRSLFLSIVCVLSIGSTFSQTNDFSLRSIDNEFTMQLSRIDYKVLVTLYFTGASQFAYVSIERSMEEKRGFRQCKYIQLGAGVNDSIVLVEHDKYAIPASEDAFYRLKTITIEGVIRTYPPVRLPGLGRKKII